MFYTFGTGFLPGQNLLLAQTSDAARINAGLIVGALGILVSGLALRGLKETFHADLNYTEQV